MVLDPQVGDRAHNHPAIAANRKISTSVHTPIMNRVIEFALLVLMVSGDIANLYIVIAVLFKDYPIVSFALTGAFTGAAVLMMEEAGRAARRVKAKSIDDPYGWGRVFLLVVPWALIGLTTFAARLVTAPDLRGGFDFDAIGSTTYQLTDWLSALLLLGLYGASGAVAYHMGFSWHSPTTSQLSALKRASKKAHKVRLKKEAQLRVLQDKLTLADYAMQQAATTSAALIAGIDVKALEFREKARLLISQKLAEPASTSGVISKGEVHE